MEHGVADPKQQLRTEEVGSEKYGNPSGHTSFRAPMEEMIGLGNRVRFGK